MVSARRHPWAHLLLATACAACGNPGDAPPPSATAPPTAAPAKAEPPPTHPLDRDLHRWAEKDLAGFEASGPYHHGTLQEGDVVHGSVALHSGRCTKVIAVADPTMVDLELSVFDPGGSLVRQEVGTGAQASLGFDHPVCPGTPGVYRVQVAARKGHGEAAFRAYQSPW